MSTATMNAPADPFTMTATSGGGNYDLLASGNYPAVLIGFIDLGTHEEEYENDDKTKRVVDTRKLALVWETPGEIKPNGDPFCLAKQFNLSFGPKSALRQFIEGWRGKKFEPEEQFDLRSIVGKPCLLNVVHRAGKGDRKYHEVGGVTAVPKGLSVPTAFREPLVYTIGSGDPVPRQEWLPYLFGQSMADVIESAKEMKARSAAPAGGEDDDIPF